MSNRVALIGGTGVDEYAELAAGRSRTVTTRFGAAEIVETSLAGRDLVFIPRHGPDHQTPPSAINYRAQVAALTSLGVEQVVGVCAVGSLRANLIPGTFAVLVDFIDLTRQRAGTFFDQPGGPVVHTDFTHPYCPAIRQALINAAASDVVPYEPNAVYVGIDGPRYESPAEIRLYRSWGAHVIGMTNLPEAVLAREAGLCYGAVAVVANLATGVSERPLVHDEVREAMLAARDRLREVLLRAIAGLPEERTCTCGSGTRLRV